MTPANGRSQNKETAEYDKEYDAALLRTLEDKILQLEEANRILANDITEQKRAEAALSITEVRYRRLFESAKDGVLILDAVTGMVVDVNPFLCETLGYVKEDIVGKIIWELGFLKDIIANQNNFLELQKKEYLRYEDMPLETADGRRIDVEFVSNVYTEGCKKVIQCNIRDITEWLAQRKRAEQALKESEENVRNYLERAPDGIFIVDNTGRYREANTSACRITGYSEEEIIKMSVRDLVAEESLEEGLTHFKEVMETGAATSDLWHKHKNGSKRCLAIDTVKLSETRVLGFCKDITERKRAEQALIQSTRDWEDTFDIINEAITIHDTDFNIIRSNKISEKLLGKNLQAILSNKCYVSYHGKDCPPGQCPSCVSMKTGKPSVCEVFEPMLDKFLEIKALPRFNQNRELIGLVHVVRDITERKQAEVERLKLEEQLKQAQKMEAIGQLAGGVAHDFNNQLSIIQGSAELLNKLVENDPQQSAYADMILNAAKQSAELTRQLLLFARKSAKECKSVSLHGVIRDIINMLGMTIDRRIKLKSVLESSSDIVLGDAIQIYSALLNLALNARDAMPNGGELTFTTQRAAINTHSVNPPHIKDGDYIIIKVRDNGIGMTREIKENIFHPFFTTKEPGKGTGLGLASVYGIIKSHQGTITVDSKPGQGALFTILLPLHENKEIPAAVEAAPIPCPSGQGTILVLDDEPLICRLVDLFLISLGYQAVIFSDIEKALEYYQGHFQEITLVMLDMNMPKASGQEVFIEFRKIHPAGKFLFASGFFEEKDMQFFRESGVHHYLQKPYMIEGLANKLKEAIENG